MLASLATIMKEKTALVTSMVYFALTMNLSDLLVHENIKHSAAIQDDLLSS